MVVKGKLKLSGNTTMSDIPEHSPSFTDLYQKTLTPLRNYLSRILGNSAEAQDVAHDAYLRIFPKIEDDSAINPEALLYTTAKRLAFNRLKRRRVAPFINGPVDLDQAASKNPGVVQQVVARQEWGQLETAIANLPQGCRKVLLLRKIELLSHKDIALRLGIAVSTVEKQHARALRLLRVELNKTTDQQPDIDNPNIERDIQS